MDGNAPDPHDIDDAIQDYGFYHSPEQVKRMYAEYVNNNLLGYSGGVLEQPDEYWYDISTMNWLKLWVEHVLPLADDTPHTDIIEHLRAGGSLTDALG